MCWSAKNYKYEVIVAKMIADPLIWKHKVSRRRGKKTHELAGTAGGAWYPREWRFYTSRPFERYRRLHSHFRPMVRYGTSSHQLQLKSIYSKNLYLYKVTFYLGQLFNLSRFMSSKVLQVYGDENLWSCRCLGAVVRRLKSQRGRTQPPKPHLLLLPRTQPPPEGRTEAPLPWTADSFAGTVKHENFWGSFN